MAVYRVQVVHASYWRGSPHRWQTTLHYLTGTGTPDFATITANLLVILRALGPTNYPGGVAEIKIYSESGGVPVYSQTYFDWSAPGTWQAYTSTTVWGTGNPPPTDGECAAVFTLPVGFSSSGKPVTLRSYWHAFAVAGGVASGPAFNSTVIAAATTQYAKLNSIPGSSGPAFVRCGPGGEVVGTTPTLVTYVGNHQRVRGRRRKALVSADGKYNGPTVKVPPASIIAD